MPGTFCSLLDPLPIFSTLFTMLGHKPMWLHQQAIIIFGFQVYLDSRQYQQKIRGRKKKEDRAFVICPPPKGPLKLPESVESRYNSH